VRTDRNRKQVRIDPTNDPTRVDKQQKAPNKSHRGR